MTCSFPDTFCKMLLTVTSDAAGAGLLRDDVRDDTPHKELLRKLYPDG